MRKFFWIALTLALLPGLAIAAGKGKSTPPDSELVYRANLGSADDITLLLNEGGNINAVDNNGIGLIFLAAGRPDDEGVNVVHALLKRGMDINSRDIQGRTALFFAAKSGNSKTVEYLLKNGADPYITDNNGDVARNYAYKFGHMDVVEQMDDFARKKIAEVNSAYERVNNELQKRYDELAKEQESVAKREQRAARTPRTRPAPAPKPEPVVEEPVADEGDDGQDDEGVAAADEDAMDAEATEDTTASDDAADAERAARAEARDADAKMRAELEEERATAIAARRQEEQAERAAAKELRETMEDTMQDITMQAYLKSEIEAEAARLKQEQEERERNDPEKRKARLAAEHKKEEERGELFRQLSYNSCQYQYWYFCYTSKMTTDLTPEALREVMDTSKQNVIDLQDSLLHDYDVKSSNVQNVSLTGKTRIFNQLNRMRSATQRRSEGVGTVEDAERRCGDISLNWDIDARSMVDERPRKSGGSKDGTGSSDDDEGDGNSTDATSVMPAPAPKPKQPMVTNYGSSGNISPQPGAPKTSTITKSSKKKSSKKSGSGKKSSKKGKKKH